MDPLHGPEGRGVPGTERHQPDPSVPPRAQSHRSDAAPVRGKRPGRRARGGTDRRLQSKNETSTKASGEAQIGATPATWTAIGPSPTPPSAAAGTTAATSRIGATPGGGDRTPTPRTTPAKGSSVSPPHPKRPRSQLTKRAADLKVPRSKAPSTLPSLRVAKPLRRVSLWVRGAEARPSRGERHVRAVQGMRLDSHLGTSRVPLRSRSTSTWCRSRPPRGSPRHHVGMRHARSNRRCLHARG